MRLAPGAQPDLPPIHVDDTLARMPEVAAALSAYHGGRPDVASALVNRAIQAQPNNARLHFLNGEIYLAWSANGFPQYRNLAGIAFRVALTADPSFLPAAQALGAYYAEGRNFPASELAYAAAINQDPSDPATLRALAYSAYLAIHPTMARWAVDRALQLAPTSWSTADSALAALAHAGSGDMQGAAAFLRRYAAAARDPKDVQRLTRAVEAWPRILAEVPPTAAPTNSTPRVRQARIAPQPANPAAVLAPPPPPPLAGGLPLAPSITAADAQVASPLVSSTTGPPVVSRWDTCDTPPNDIQPGNSLADATETDAAQNGNQSLTVLANGTDHTAPLPSLPAPCADAPLPRMAFVDVVVIRVSDTATAQYGVNLLDSLQVVLGGSITHQRVFQTNALPTSTTTVVASAGLPPGGITYSLNIANATQTSSEIVARPTLTALDRRSSRFFSGSSLVAGLQGGAYSGSSFIEIPTGVELVVSPTFIGGDRLLLAVRAARSTFQQQQIAQVGFSNEILTARNAVTASVLMRLGQTLILSGLTQRELDRQSNKVPGLGDLPGGDLALSQQNRSEETDSILILLTPRASDSDPGTMTSVFTPVDAASFRAAIAERERDAGLDPHSDATVETKLDAASRSLVFVLDLLSGA